MTIKGLNDYLKRCSIKSNTKFYKTVPLSQLPLGCSVAIDLSEYLYIFYNSVKKEVLDELRILSLAGVIVETPISQDRVRHGVCQRFIQLTGWFTSSGVKPIFVFDGVAVPQKDAVKQVRTERRMASERKLNTVLYPEPQPEDQSMFPVEEVVPVMPDTPAGTIITHEQYIEAYIRAEKMCNVPPSKDYKDMLSEMFQVLSVQYYHALNEADTLCAQLVRSGIAHAVVSQDSDQIAYCTRMIIKKLFDDAGTIFMTYTGASVISTALGFPSMSHLTAFCVLCGCDYSENIRGNGPVRNMALMKSPDVISTVRKTEAFKIFTTPIPIPQTVIEGHCPTSRETWLQKWWDPKVPGPFHEESTQ
jgi:5'-3' exonuclease